MSLEWILYHNPRCSKSRAALKYLADKGIQPQVIEYLKTPPTKSELEELLRKLGRDVRDLLRDGEDEYTQLGLHNPHMTRDELLDALVQHPILLQRPIVVRGERAVIARPAEAIDLLLDE